MDHPRWRIWQGIPLGAMTCDLSLHQHFAQKKFIHERRENRVLHLQEFCATDNRRAVLSCKCHGPVRQFRINICRDKSHNRNLSLGYICSHVLVLSKSSQLTMAIILACSQTESWRPLLSSAAYTQTQPPDFLAGHPLPQHTSGTQPAVLVRTQPGLEL